MPRVIVNGGSIGGAVALIGAALGVQFFIVRRRKKRAGSRPPREFNQTPRYSGSVSASAVRMLMETNPIQHLVFEVQRDDSAPLLPAQLSGKGIKVNEAGLEEFFLGVTHGTSYRTADWPPCPPSLNALMVFIACNEQSIHRVMALAAEAGYQRCLSAVLQSITCLTEAASKCVDLVFISRDALVLLLGYSQNKVMAATPPCVLLDLRRYDERTLYGSIRGSHHIPVDQLPSALQLTPTSFEQTYRFPKPSPEDIIVLHSRAGRRAAWAAQLCADAGYGRVFVYKQGTYGWRFDSTVKPYREYALGDPPPDPETVFQPDVPNLVVGAQELVKMGLINSAAPTSLLQ